MVQFSHPYMITGKTIALTIHNFVSKIMFLFFNMLSRFVISSPEDLPNPGIEPWSPALQADSLPSEPPRKSKNTVVGSLSLLQAIFPTQGSNRGLLHCKQTFYQLSLPRKPQVCHNFLSKESFNLPKDQFLCFLRKDGKHKNANVTSSYLHLA